MEPPESGSSSRFCFPKSRRLLRRREFVLVQRRGKRFSIGPMLACIRYVDEQPTRVGITTSKRVGRACVRTRIRRLLRESIRRLFLPAFPVGIEVVFIAKNGLSPTLHQSVFDDAMSALIERLLARQQRRQRRQQSADAPGAGPSSADANAHGKAVEAAIRAPGEPEEAAGDSSDSAGSAKRGPGDEA